jgi:hypothetical protein
MHRRAVLLVLVAACQSSPPPRVAKPAPPPPPAPAPAPSAAPAPDPLAPLRARGTLHGQAVKIATGGRERWLGFLGTPEMARAAWVVTPGSGKDELRPLEQWPAGARVTGAVVRGPTAYVLLESMALLDQPAGLRAVWAEGTGPVRALAGVKDTAELQQRLESPPAPGAQVDEAALLAVLKSAAASEAALGQALVPAGADFYEVWQDTFFHHVERVLPGRVASSSRAAEMLAIVQDALESAHCRGDACDAEEARVLFGELPGGGWGIRGFERGAIPARRSAGGPRAIAPSPSTSTTAALLKEHVRTVHEILGEAPLGNGGTIGVALGDLEVNGPLVAVRDGAHDRVYPLVSMGYAGAQLTGAKYEARFADVDADGRTDAIVRVSGNTPEGTPVSFAQVFLAPPASVQVRRLTADHGTELALSSAPSIDAAVQAALAVPARGVTGADACKVLAGTSNVQGFRKAATADVRVLSFDEPTMPTYRALVVPERVLRPEDVKSSGQRCKDLDCSPTRPFCSLTDGHYAEYYWFTWVNNQLRLAGAAFGRE